MLMKGNVMNVQSLMGDSVCSSPKGVLFNIMISIFIISFFFF